MKLIMRRSWIKLLWYMYQKDSKERLMARNQLTEEEAQQRIASQWPIEMKKNEQISF